MLVEEYTLNIDENIVIPYEEAGSAGYIWDFNKEQDVVSLENNKEDIEPEMIGSFTKGLITVTGLKKGNVIFSHKRPWEKNETQNKQIIIKVV